MKKLITAALIALSFNAVAEPAVWKWIEKPTFGIGFYIDVNKKNREVSSKGITAFVQHRITESVMKNTQYIINCNNETYVQKWSLTFYSENNKISMISSEGTWEDFNGEYVYKKIDREMKTVFEITCK